MGKGRPVPDGTGRAAYREWIRLPSGAMGHLDSSDSLTAERVMPMRMKKANMTLG